MGDNAVVALTHQVARKNVRLIVMQLSAVSRVKSVTTAEDTRVRKGSMQRVMGMPFVYSAPQVALRQVPVWQLALRVYKANFLEILGESNVMIAQLDSQQI
jgi:hypothetical protein